jgi:hypothetical protein
MMNNWYLTVWIVALVYSICLIFNLVGVYGLVKFCPEGDRKWLFPAQLASIGFYTVIIIFNPFTNP